jgi:hypothetical protein
MVRKYVKFVHLRYNGGQYCCTTMLRASHRLHRSDITVVMENTKDMFAFDGKLQVAGCNGVAGFLLPAPVQRMVRTATHVNIYNTQPLLSM